MLEVTLLVSRELTWERTPVHTSAAGSGSRISNRGDRAAYEAGSSTAYGGWGTSSSSHSYGGATQYGGGYGGATQYGGPGNYHSFESGSRTPSALCPWASSSTNSIAISKPWDASTPSGPSLYNSARTPNVSSHSAPTPGNSGALNVPTPYAYPMDAPTPGGAMGGGRKGPYNASTSAAGAYGAPTPAFSENMAETPRPYGGDSDGDELMDDGPRYDEGTPNP